MVVDIFMEKDAEWVCEKLTNQRAVYRKLPKKRKKMNILSKWFVRQRKNAMEFMNYCKKKIPSPVKDYVRNMNKFK